MARIDLNHFTKSASEFKGLQDEAYSEYIIERGKILQINMFGRATRPTPKPSQFIQIDKATAKRLVELFQEAGLLDN